MAQPPSASIGIEISSRQNPLVKEIRKLHEAKGRHREHQCLLEGTHLLEVACEVNYPLLNVCATPQWIAQNLSLWQRISTQAQKCQVCSSAVLEAIATTVNPDGIVATAPRPTLDPQQMPKTGIALALETIQDPGNLGTIIRTAAAANAAGLWLSADSVDLDHPKVLRSSAGQWFRLPMAVSADLATQVKHCQSQGWQIVATDSHASFTYWELDYCQPTLILLGNEGNGLSPELSALADKTVTIPLSGGVESLNVAIAAALILYEAQRQKVSKS